LLISSVSALTRILSTHAKARTREVAAYLLKGHADAEEALLSSLKSDTDDWVRYAAMSSLEGTSSETIRMNNERRLHLVAARKTE
jgi:hypothetical protein